MVSRDHISAAGGQARVRFLNVQAAQFSCRRDFRRFACALCQEDHFTLPYEHFLFQRLSIEQMWSELQVFGKMKGDSAIAPRQINGVRIVR